MAILLGEDCKRCLARVGAGLDVRGISPTGAEDGCGPVGWQRQRPQKLSDKILTKRQGGF